jgi:hypothetical protein
MPGDRICGFAESSTSLHGKRAINLQHSLRSRPHDSRLHGLAYLLLSTFHATAVLLNQSRCSSFLHTTTKQRGAVMCNFRLFSHVLPPCRNHALGRQRGSRFSHDLDIYWIGLLTSLPPTAPLRNKNITGPNFQSTPGTTLALRTARSRLQFQREVPPLFIGGLSGLSISAVA